MENPAAVEANMDTETGNTLDATLSGVVDAAASLAQSTPLPVHPSADREGNAEEAGASEDMHVDVNLVDPGTKNSPLPVGSQGRGRQLREEKMHHLVLPSTGQKYAVSLFWPRDEEGKPIKQSNKHRGKRTPDDYPWGATLLDFFRVKVTPASNPNETAIMTSSQLLRTMKEFGELKKAKYEIEWAKSEGEPKVQNVASTQNLVEAVEQEVNQSRTEYSSYSAARDTTSADGLDIPITSPFHPSHYPAPWPFIPFKRMDTKVPLQERIPSYLLPQTLYVHDPFNLLSAVETTHYNPEWTSKPDIIHTYTLHLREKTLTEVENDRGKAEELEELKSRTSIILRYTQTIEQIQDREPIIEVALPPYPRRLTKVDESHLYVSPIGKVGRGNHSVVYKVEWELPRELLVRPKICTPCLRESVEREIERLKATGEWDSILRASGIGSEETLGVSQTGDESIKMDEVGNPPIRDKDGEVLQREIVCVVSPDVPPMEVLGVIDTRGIWSDLMRHREKTSVLLRFEEGGEVNATEPRSAPIIRISPPVSYRDPSLPHILCSHDSACPVPRTAKFTVVAKLSIKGDTHLEAEAQNYQEFPDYFFEHWSGYAFFKRLDRIVPLGAIVPQFYGYYTLKDKETQGEEGAPAANSYLSPILLLEHCGMSIETDRLSVEEQEECASLLVRFHHAGWLHESVYARNVLVQQRRPTTFPGGTSPGDRSFRLIDFGRSKEFKEAEEREEEDRVMRKLFKDLPASRKPATPRVKVYVNYRGSPFWSAFGPGVLGTTAYLRF